MPRKPLKLSTGRRSLREVIKMCEAIEKRRFNPFLLSISGALSVLREYFHVWRLLEDHCLDAKAIDKLSSSLRLQNEWLKFQSSRLYADPAFIEHKVNELDVKSLGEAFLKCWHPILELEQLTTSFLKEAVKYWNGLPSIEERRLRLPTSPPAKPEEATVKDLIKQGLMHEESFTRSLESLWKELKVKASENGRTLYWSFIYADTYQETVKRAYITSFLLTYGYADLEFEDGLIYLKPLTEPKPQEKRENLVTIPIVVSWEEWKRRGGV